MNLGTYQAAGYVAPSSPTKDRQKMKEKWEEYQSQQRAQKIAKSYAQEDHHSHSPSATTASRKRAGSHAVPQPDLHDSQDRERQRRFSSASNHNSPFLLAHRSSQPEIKRLSGAFNAPTNIEVERHEDHKKSSRGADRLRKWEDRVKGWVRA